MSGVDIDEECEIGNDRYLMSTAIDNHGFFLVKLEYTLWNGSV